MRLGGEKSEGHGKLLVRALKYDRPKDLPGWIQRRICQIVLYSDGLSLTRVGHQYVKSYDGRIRWSKWTVLDNDAMRRATFEQFVHKLEQKKFLIKKAPDSIINAAVVWRRMRQE